MLTKANQTHQRQAWSLVYLGLGSNVGDAKQHLLDAINQLKQCQNIKEVTTSRLYISKPVDNTNQENFYNVAICLETDLTPHELLEHCKHIERLHQRTHLYHWGPRSLDIDILCYEQITLNTPILSIPHAEIANRDFVIKPLLDLDPTLALPLLGQISKLPSPTINIIKIEAFHY